MRHTVRAGLVCAVLSGLIGLVGLGVGIGVVIGEHTPSCAAGR